MELVSLELVILDPNQGTGMACAPSRGSRGESIPRVFRPLVAAQIPGL